ncbi:DUF3426 domain-containing protein [Paraburkholderia sp. Cy-641]|uniref:zinc-ribbon and DUF3426 domain-containing protein n=1 Tax=Paraburkholderia sp. Cy-641 TaxID=2608337 RepID=UPI0014241591|nr:zinc-ribbon and DUF3426 domain-containing protein [Paraburkholderia sp. Cy-641]NIF80220.1 DUF3426 domain-containing protein [Paraburkholderia sp. Cy-641]
MLLATRCPFCETVFRLQPAQLAQRRGLVRCGHCQEVFDASGSLFDVSGGDDLSTARPVAASAIEALAGAPETNPGAEARDSWASASGSTLDSRLRHHADSMQLAPLPLDNGKNAPSSAPTAPTSPTRRASEPELPTGGFTAPLPRDQEPTLQEPTLADAPPDPFAYPSDDGLAGAARRMPAEAPPPAEPPRAAPVPPSADEAPRVWHKTGRVEPSALREPAVPLHGIPDNEPHFGAIGSGIDGSGVADFGAAAGLGEVAAATAAAGGSGTGAPGGPRPPRGPAASSGEPFSVNPVNSGADPFPVMRETRPAESKRIGWLVAGAIIVPLLVIALLAQLAWWQREAVMVNVPRSQSLYAKVCAHLGCQLSPPHDIEGLLVEPSDLRQIDGPHKLELKMPLHNRMNIALAYPAIELTLLDEQNNVAVRRVLWPQDYVPPGTVIADGLPAHATQTMIVHLDTGNAVASNFRVQIFYP